MGGFSGGRHLATNGSCQRSRESESEGGGCVGWVLPPLDPVSWRSSVQRGSSPHLAAGKMGSQGKDSTWTILNTPSSGLLPYLGLPFSAASTCCSFTSMLEERSHWNSAQTGSAGWEHRETVWASPTCVVTVTALSRNICLWPDKSLATSGVGRLSCPQSPAST